MAYTKWAKETEIYTVDEAIEYYSNVANLTTYQSIMDSSIGLERLANNTNILNTFIKKSLENSSSDLKQTFYSHQSFVIGSGKNIKSGKAFTLRGVIWHPEEKKRELKESFDYAYSYHFTHDHNFDFLTIGYKGPGYRTKIYEYDPNTIKGYPGESVNIKHLEDTYLSEKKMLLFRGSKDIHTQLHPEKLSVSINLLLIDEQDAPFQYDFDIEKSQIIDLIYSGQSNIKSLIEIVGQTGGYEDIQLLKNICNSNDFALQVKEQAMTSIQKILLKTDH